MSTLIFVVHGSCGRIAGYILKGLSVGFLQNEFVKVSITIVISILVGMCFLNLRDKSRLKILKYAC